MKKLNTYSKRKPTRLVLRQAEVQNDIIFENLPFKTIHGVNKDDKVNDLSSTIETVQKRLSQLQRILDEELKSSPIFKGQKLIISAFNATNNKHLSATKESPIDNFDQWLKSDIVTELPHAPQQVDRNFENENELQEVTEIGENHLLMHCLSVSKNPVYCPFDHDDESSPLLPRALSAAPPQPPSLDNSPLNSDCSPKTASKTLDSENPFIDDDFLCATISEKLALVENDQINLNSLFKACNQKERDLFSFDDFIQSFQRNSYSLKKIAEATYSEVFALLKGKNYDSVLKIIPICTEIDGKDVNDLNIEDFPYCSKINDIYQEIRISQIIKQNHIDQLLSKPVKYVQNLIGFNAADFAFVLKGKYPSPLLKCWDSFARKHKQDAVNIRPDCFSDEQHYVAISSKYAGVDLEHFQVSSNVQLRSILLQTVLSLACAEVNLGFEHRDLHWGNIMIKPTNVETWGVELQPENSINHCFEFSSQGLEISLIDFSLSRIKDSSDGSVYFVDLNEQDDIFNGDANDDYQFEIYRLMKDEIQSLAKKQNDSTFVSPWSLECFKTNVMWIIYLIDKLTKIKFITPNSTKESKRESKLIHQEMNTLLKKLQKFKYTSAYQIVTEDQYFTKYLCC